MSSFGFPDWKKIGWRVGKRLKDILNPPTDTGPSKEERRVQRLRDALKGFAYFDDFDELAAWRLGDVDPIQQANTPLLERPAARVHDESIQRTEVLLCHDYNGGYHDYESVRPTRLKSEPYSCHYLQYINVFVYFSHKLVCVPPPTWVNTMHRNGVKVLGTFIIEPQTPGIERMLAVEDEQYGVAVQLASMAHAYGFDGWLLNVEKEFPKNFPDLTRKLNGFILNLRRQLGEKGEVIWYDALNIDNEVEYQNGLTAKNIEFARSADALFTNYRWTKARLQEAQSVAGESDIAISDVYFGIDVWAQNTYMPSPPRITFPEKGGGGTNTGLAMRTLAEHGFSTAVFGPAWTHEHFSTSPPIDAPAANSIPIAKAVDRSMWKGFCLPDELGCDCRKGRPHHTKSYRSEPITKYAREYPAGSVLFLETNFSGALSVKAERGSLHPRIHSNLSSQAVLPNLLPVQASEWENLQRGPPTQVLYGVLQDECPPSLMVFTQAVGIMTGDTSPEGSDHPTSLLQLCLFKLSMPADGSLQAVLRFGKPHVAGSTKVGLFAAYTVTGEQDLVYRYSEIPHDISRDSHRMSLDYQGDGICLVELGVYCERLVDVFQPLQLLRIGRLVISPNHRPLDRDFAIYDIRAIQRGTGLDTERRLAWRWRGADDKWPKWLPWSMTTGPFSHFTISVQRREVGKAYCLEFPVRAEDIVECESSGESVEVRISGTLFGGQEIMSLPVMVSINHIASEQE